MSPDEFCPLMQKHIAQISANSSSLRNPGASGAVAAAQQFLISFDIAAAVTADAAIFRQRLDDATDILTGLFPDGARHWGRARKVINIFLRDSLYNRYLADHYHLDSIASFLEVPLDGDVAANLQHYATQNNKALTKWPQIKGLTPTISDEYQSIATGAARDYEIDRAHLDLMWWRNRP
jgi:hypothetical protein